MKVLALIAVALLLPQEKNEAEELFRKMEEKLARAKSVQMKFAGKIEPQGVELAGEILLDEGNRCRCTLEGKRGQATESAMVISDGKAVQLFEGGKPVNPTFDTPDSLGKLLRISAARSGTVGSIDGSQREEKAKVVAETAFVASDFKLGAKEKVGDREAHAVEYKLVRKGEKDTSATVWIDTQSHLPLKRLLKMGTKSLSETYSDVKLDERIDPAKFEHPKEAK